MITDKDGKEMSLAEVLSYLVGTDETDMAKSVIDFAVYTINEDKTVGDPQYYLVASEANYEYIVHGALYNAGN